MPLELGDLFIIVTDINIEIGNLKCSAILKKTSNMWNLISIWVVGNRKSISECGKMMTKSHRGKIFGKPLPVIIWKSPKTPIYS